MFLKKQTQATRTKNILHKVRCFYIIALILSAIIMLSGCGAIQGLITSIPLFEEADISSLAEKAEKAWDEVGKDALKDATEEAKNALVGKNDQLKWPETEATENIPKVNTGTISKIDEKSTLTEITIKEISSAGYDEYIKELEEKVGSSISKGIYRCSNNRLLSAIYDDDSSTLTITISTIKQNIEEKTNDASTNSEDLSN